ncbi:MAG: glycine--tRNA ligase subunit beta [Cyanobacteria bacterium RUI128]|nr:glycine--tRNA ligase subunit beta [Cyanobacteria bacterium RUI128]
MSKYLLEIGVEELPYKFITSAQTQLKDSFEKFLVANGITFEGVNVLTTPRRLAVIIDGLADAQPDSTKIFKGPIKKIAYDENGNLSKAGEGFAKKNGLTPDDLYVEDDYVMAKIEVKGKSTKDVLVENIPNIVLKLQGSHFMRWADHEEKFSRPIRWLVSIYNNEELKIKILDIESSKISRGHRSYEGVVEINNPDEYKNKLKEGYVIVDPEERRNKIIEIANAKASEIGATTRISDDLLEEVTNICEWPVAVICNFDEEYLNIPDEVTITVMESHQRYFALFKDGKLTNNFITIANYIGNDFENIKAGNLRVIKARLDDAVFFVKNDTKKKLEEYVENLKGMTFQKGMGSVYDKTQRLIKLSKQIAEELGINDTNIIRTAYLCKADLATNLVFEFTELQGFIGSDYARISGENDAVVQGVKEHYFPLNADSELASGIEGQVVGISDKIDNICAVFASGKKPTGSSDPLGVRRAALGIIKTIIENNLEINITELIKSAIELLPVETNCQADVEEFIIQRLTIFLADSYKKDILEACLIGNPLEKLSDYIKRVQALSQFDSPMTVENANRVIRILKDSSFDIIDEDLFQTDEERNLYSAVKSLEELSDYSAYLNQLIGLNSKVDAFFDKVLVMDKDENIKNNRIGLLTLLRGYYDLMADFSKLSK